MSRAFQAGRGCSTVTAQRPARADWRCRADHRCAHVHLKKGKAHACAAAHDRLRRRTVWRPSPHRAGGWGAERCPSRPDRRQGGRGHRRHAAPPHSPPSQPIYLNRSYSFADRAADLVSRMTRAEKASQMDSSAAPAIPRLGVQAYGWWNESLHGVSRLQLTPSGNATVLDNTTSYPIDLSLGSSWDTSLMYQEASAISDEAREVVPENSLNLDFYSPTVNLSRDPRWGRNDETFSEDPLLTAAIASQYVNGMQGQDQQGHRLPQGGGYLKTITTIKHFAANNTEDTRLTGSANMDERTLREYYTAQFKQIIQQSHPGSIMSAYNEVNGTPSAADVHL